jgi:hypothetical protein
MGGTAKSIRSRAALKWARNVKVRTAFAVELGFSRVDFILAIRSDEQWR